MPRAQKRKTTHDVELTDVDSDSDVDLQPVRLPHGLPMDDPPPQMPVNSHLEVEQVCRRHLDNGYIPMSVFPWLAQTLPSELLRASHLHGAEPTTTLDQLGYGATPRSTRAQQLYLPTWFGLARTPTSRPCLCCATSTWPPTWTGITSQAPSTCSCRSRPSAAENFGFRKTTDQTYLRKASIKDVITPFVCRDWSSTPQASLIGVHPSSSKPPGTVGH